MHTYPTFDNKLNCAIELYYTHRDDGNLAAPEHRSQDPWRHPMGPLEHWPSGLVEQLLQRKPPAYVDTTEWCHTNVIQGAITTSTKTRTIITR